MSNTSRWNAYYNIANYDLTTNGYDNRKINPAYHHIYRNELTEFKNAGGDYFRMLFFSDWYEIEFEKLNNYYDRLNTAWEFDRLLEHCEDLGLKVDLCLQNYESGQKLGDFSQQWDWSAPSELFSDPNYTAGCIIDPTNTNGYCYNTELGLPTLEEFLTNSTAIEYYQYRLRYIVSRWGYSPSIAIMMLKAEMNNYSKYQNFTSVAAGCERDNIYYLYNQNPDDFLGDISFWQNEMCKFLKTDQYFPHLTSVNYTGCPRAIWDVQTNSNNYAIENGDISYYSEYVDVATYDHYEDFWTKFKGMYENIEDVVWRDQFINDHAVKIQKPMMVAETGDGGAQHCDNGISYIKDVWVSAFMGIAGSAMNWEYQYQYNLMEHNVRLREFMEDVNLASTNVEWSPGRRIRNDDKASVYYLRSDENQQRAFGVIDNHTVNQYSKGIGNCNMGSPGQPYNIAVNVSPNILNPTNRLTIANMGSVKRYVIEYYNAITGSLVYTDNSKFSQIDGELRLVFPELGTEFTGNGFLMAFKVRRYGQPSFMTPLDTLYEQTIADAIPVVLPADTIPEPTLTDWTALNKTDGLFEINPNPATDQVKVSFENPDKQKTTISVVDNKGILLNTYETTTDFIIFDVSSLAAGVYNITLQLNGIRQQRKLVKL